MGFFDKLGFSKPKAEAPKAEKGIASPMGSVDDVRNALLSKKEELLKEIADFKKNNFSRGISEKMKQLQGEVDAIDEQLIATLKGPEGMLKDREAKSAGEMIDTRQVEKPEFMKEQEAAENAKWAEQQKLEAEKRDLEKEKIELLQTIDDADREAHINAATMLKQRMDAQSDFIPGKQYDVNVARTAEAKKRLAEVYERLSDIGEKLEN